MHRTYISSSKQAGENGWGKEYPTEKATNSPGNKLDQEEIDTGSLLRIAEATELLTVGHKVLNDEIKQLKIKEATLAGELFAERAYKRECQVQIKKMKKAIRWACGEIGEFEKPKNSLGNYWWRSVLKEKAGLKKQ
jgi:hypothetical protein